MIERGRSPFTDPRQDPRFLKALHALEEAVRCQQQGQNEEADRLYAKLVKKNPEYFDALNLYGLFNYQQGNLLKAAELLKKAARINPRSIKALNNLGIVFGELKRSQESLDTFERAIALDPTNPQTLNNRGNALADLNRLDGALESFGLAIKIQSNFFDAYINRARVFLQLGRYEEALADNDRALIFAPLHPDIHNNRGGVLLKLHRTGEALASYDRALAIRPDHANALGNRGSILNELGRYDEALSAFDKALAIKPDLPGTKADRIYSKMHLCGWSNHDAECLEVISSMRGGAPTSPFVVLGISSSREDQLHCATTYSKKNYPPADKPVLQGGHYRHDRIRVAYLSGDFRDHPVAYLLAGVFEQHDQDRFETFAISFGPDNPNEMRTRLGRAFSRFIDVREKSDFDIAKLLKELEIDIAIDLMGHTTGSRMGILAHRAAPIQINYLGFPGTTGASHVDYIIADPILIPERHRNDYTEKIAYLPNTFMPGDSNRPISDGVLDRMQHGLPKTGTVFCCFNNTYKLNPSVFECWTRILNRVEGSVLWLSATNATAADNLRKAASAKGVDPNRLVFAKRLPSSADHLARHRLADLFLDSLPYNAHTTANDALWSGLPVLTQIGETFAGRVAASLLNTVGLPELIKQTQEEYEKAAIELATDPARLALFKDRLAQNRLTTPIFNTQLFTRHIENAYAVMAERYQAGLPPDHIFVAESNLGR